MGNAKERKDAVILKITTLKEKTKKADVLAAALEKTKNSLPESAKSALTEFRKEKKPK